MNRSHLAVFTLMIASSFLLADDQKPQRLEPITADSLNYRDVIGKIGVPLGHGATIEATIVSGDSLRSKGYDGYYLFKVETVNGEQLDGLPLMKFVVDYWSEARLVPRKDQFDDLVAELKLHEVPEHEIATLKQNYVGSKVKFVAYEEGYFIGQPKSLPKGTERVLRAETGFGFSTYLVVVKQLKPIQKAK